LIVSATKTSQPVSEVAIAVDVFNRSDIGASPALSIDDKLKASAAFSLFRRAGSLSANPTAQGVSLRNLGPNAASRTLVLLDGVPINDPFGGWVTWTKIPRLSTANVEIVRGGGSSVWGNTALAGTIHIISDEPRIDSQPYHQFQLEAGDFQTFSAELSSETYRDKNSFRINAGSLHSDGFRRTTPAFAGSIDRPTNLKQENLQLSWTHRNSSGTRSLLSARTFSEERGNGTPLQRNRTREVLISAHIRGNYIAFDHDFDWTATAYFQNQSFSNLFSSVSLDRSTESPVLDQFLVPADAVGASTTATWSSDSGVSTIGSDFRRIEGETGERYFIQNGEFSRERHAGGTQIHIGVFAHHNRILSSSVRVSLSARLDKWTLSNGYRRETDLLTGTSLLNENYVKRTGSELTTRAGLTWRISENWRWRSSIYQAFRVPTLNELYRPFRIGNTITSANSQLSPETLDGAEIGTTWFAEQGSVRITAFTNNLHQAIDNVIVGKGPGFVPNVGFVPTGGLGRRRENISLVRVQGVEVTGTYRPSSLFNLTVDYLYSDASNQKTKNRLPHVPQHTLTTRVEWLPLSDWRVQVQARHESDAFEDDSKTLLLNAFTTTDFRLCHQISPRTTVFLAIENIFAEEIITRRTDTGLTDLGTPCFTRIGIKRAW
jgi:outer membrane cobalamin receptor